MSQTVDAKAMIDAMVSSIPLLESQAGVDLVDTTVRRLIQDIAYQIYPVDEVATRYGFETTTRLKAWLLRNPGVVGEISKMRAIHLSDASTKDRSALKAQHAIEAAIPATAGMSTNPQMPGEIRMKALDALMYIGGFKGGAAADKQAQTGAQFRLNINFSGNRRETITATVVDDKLPTYAGDDGTQAEDDA